ncbi:protein SHQ1 homolog [Physella acuta]|uniref:protein SHQ1 homolog n=1 Tax=Physella acuta TaxID=109671 RepID=UPI0027DB8EF9|nr:protein SHQ1 homolog [Physella acuta]
MLTPKFSLSQDSDHVFVTIYIPYIKITEADCFIDDDEFYFHSEPYYLRLHLPGKIKENQHSQYDFDTHNLTVSLTKQTKGECFEGLDLLTKLLTPKVEKFKHKEIEVIVDNTTGDQDKSEEGPECEEDDWFFEQVPCTDLQPNAEFVSKPSYGFANRKSSCLNNLTSEFTEIIDLKDPDNTLQINRRLLREKQEEAHFNCEHYLADFFEDDAIQELVFPDYGELTGEVGTDVIFTEKEREKLLQLPRREYIIDEQNIEPTYLGLVDLMLAYAYNYRFTQGESNVESEWTICKLSSTLCWLDTFQNIKEVVVSFARRSLTYPLYRNWKLFLKVFSDVKIIFQVGKNQILKCLLAIHGILSESEIRYPLNDLYITDYCVWVQSADPVYLGKVSQALLNLNISKSDLGLKLVEMETDAKLLLDDIHNETEKETDLEELSHILANRVKITDALHSDSDDDASSNTSDSESSDDDETVSTDASESSSTEDKDTNP